MSEQLPPCPLCNCEYTYEDGDLFICPECAHEWPKNAVSTEGLKPDIKDAHGVLLANGDNVVVIKDLKLKGSSGVIKGGTKVKNIRLNYESDHNLDCKVDGMGSMGLKSEFVKKV